MSSLFSSSSFAHALPLLLLAPCRCWLPHPSPPSTASSSHPLPDRCLLELHPAPVHLYDPSSSSPDNPSSPSPLLLPLDVNHHRQPTPASLRPSQQHPEHRAAEYFLPNCSGPAGDPYSGLPASFPRRRSPPLWTSLPGELLPPRHPNTSPPPYRLAPRTLPATPRHQHRRNSAGPPSTGAMGANSPASRSRAKWPSGLGTPGRAGLAGAVGRAHCYSGILQLPFE
jgi:hypothetical protein